MTLPIRTTVADIDAVCGYLVTKPTGATLAEAKAVVNKRHLDGRKLSAFKFWGLINDDVGNKMKVTDRGRRCVSDSGAARSEALREVIRDVYPYDAAVERVMHRREETISATDLAAHWHEHFRSDVSEFDKILNDQAICFFHIAQGADLGTLKIGRKGMPTRFDFDADVTRDICQCADCRRGTRPPFARSTRERRYCRDCRHGFQPRQGLMVLHHRATEYSSRTERTARSWAK